MYQIKSPELCLNVDPYFDKVEVLRPFWPDDEAREKYERVKYRSESESETFWPDDEAREKYERVKHRSESESESESEPPGKRSMQVVIIPRRTSGRDSAGCQNSTPVWSRGRRGSDAPSPKYTVGLEPSSQEEESQEEESQEEESQEEESQEEESQEEESQEEEEWEECKSCHERVRGGLEEHIKKRHADEFRDRIIEKEGRLKDRYKKYLLKNKSKCPKCKIEFCTNFDAKCHIRAVHLCIECPDCDKLIESNHKSSMSATRFLKHKHCRSKYIRYFKVGSSKELLASHAKYFDPLTDKCIICDLTVKGTHKPVHFRRHVGLRFRCRLNRDCFLSFCDPAALKEHASRDHKLILHDSKVESKMHWLMVGKNVNHRK